MIFVCDVMSFGNFFSCISIWDICSFGSSHSLFLVAVYDLPPILLAGMQGSALARTKVMDMLVLKGALSISLIWLASALTMRTLSLKVHPCLLDID